MELGPRSDKERLDAVFAAAGLLPPLHQGHGLGLAGGQGLDRRVGQDARRQPHRTGNDGMAAMKQVPRSRKRRRKGTGGAGAGAFPRGRRPQGGGGVYRSERGSWIGRSWRCCCFPCKKEKIQA